MVIKKYQGKTEAAAMDEARKELGAGVVLMNSKSVKQRGFFNFLKPHVIEVTVAKEEEIEIKSEEKERKPIMSDSIVATNTTVMAKESVSAGKEDRVLEEKLDSLHFLLEQQIQREKEERQSDEAVLSEKSELELPKEEKDDELKLFLKLIRTVLAENEVDEKYIGVVMDDIEKTLKPDIPMEHVLSHIYQRMVLKFGKAERIEPATEGPKVVFFVGTTGVGKTTTIAKIASKLIVDEKKRVALLTADTYRIAAAEQLRTYANILEVPFRVIYSTEDMEAAVRDYVKCDYILVDTAGHSHHNNEQRSTMSEFIQCLKDKAEEEVFLVLSATTKYRDLLSIADAYGKIGTYKLIFTKLDETESYGNLLNLKLHTGAPMSYITCGQNVPEDIERFNAQVIVKRLLGGSA